MCACAHNRTKIENKTENGKRKTENFCFSFGAKSGTDAAEREQRVLAHYAEPQGGKACEAGLKRKTFNLVSSE